MSIKNTLLSLVLAGSLGFIPVAAQEGSPTVQVKDFKVSGNTLLSEDELQAVLAPSKGQALTFQGLRDLADRLTEAYNKKGYFTVRAFLPEQTVRDGTVSFVVTEAKKGNVDFEGNEGYSTDFLKWYMEPALEAEYLNKDDVERQILLINELMGIKSSTVLEAGEKAGTIDMTVRSEETPFQRFGVDYNNYGNLFTGYNRPGANLELANLTGNGDRLSLRGMRSIAERGVTLFTANYNLPVSNEGTTLSLMYSNAAFAVGRELQVLDLRGDANVYGAFLRHPFIRSSRANLDFNAGMMWQDINNSLLSQQISRDRLRGLILGVSGDWAEDDARNFFNVRMTQDVGTLLGGLSAGDPFSSRQAGGGYNAWNIDLARVQRLSDQSWMFLRGSHQFAFSPLPTAQQFGVGGIDSVRGYRQAGYLGDGGYSLSAEFRYAPLEDDVDFFQIAAFVDHAGAYLKRPFTGEIPHLSATGAGLGLRFKLSDNTILRADFGVPVGNNPLVDQGGRNIVPHIFFSNNF